MTVVENPLKDAKVAYEYYELPGELVDIQPLGNGLINKTYQITHTQENKEKQYVLQAINHHIFPNVRGLMENIEKVTSYLREKYQAEGRDASRETLRVIRTKEGHLTANLDNGSYWRIYDSVENSYSLDKVENPQQFYITAKAFGRFAYDLNDFDASQLVEVIPQFHDTRNRYRQLEEAIRENRVGRVKEVQAEIDFIQNRKADCFLLYDLLDEGVLPLRVTHNDTKLNNIMFDSQTKEPLCIVDLDTVMPGLVLFDFGDSIRFGANDCAEDEPDLSKVNFDFDLYETYVKGFIEGTNGILTEAELEYLPWGARVITLEQGIRFLTDYINGDVYYQTTRSGQNLDRARTQLKLVQDMENVWDKMVEAVKNAQK